MMCRVTAGMKLIKNDAYSRTTLIPLLGMLAFTLLSLNITRSIRSLILQEAHDYGRRQPSVQTVLLHLYEQLPNVTSPESIPPFREVTYVIPRQLEMPSSIITLSTQLTVSSLPRLVQLLERWGGPISCAVHLPDPSAIQALYDFVQAQDKLFHDLITFHVMLEKPTPHYDYPISRLRNLALLNIETENFFLCDVDFIPQKDAYDHMVQFLSAHSNVNVEFKKLYVLPAFEIVGEGDRNNNSTVTSIDEVPQDKNELLSMLPTGKLKPLHMDDYAKGHGPTDYDKWYKCPQNESYPIEYRWRFEPSVIGNKYGIPVFNERVRGFGYSQSFWVAEAHLLGYHLEVLCDHFVVHMDHARRKGGEAGNKSRAINWYEGTYLPLRYNVVWNRQ